MKISRLMAILCVSLVGCASSGPRDYDCYKVTGPLHTGPGEANKQEIKKIVQFIDGHMDLFHDQQSQYICIDITPSKELRSYPRGK
jgi:hypothetical protein